MKNLMQWIEANIGKLIGIPFSVSSIQFLIMLVHAMSDGVIDHNEMEALMQVGNGSSMIMLALAMAYLKMKK